MRPFVTQFFVSMFQVLCLGIQTLNFIDKNILAIGITSMLISLSWIIMVKATAKKGWQQNVGLVLGGSVGAMLSIPLHNLVLGVKIC